MSFPRRLALPLVAVSLLLGVYLFGRSFLWPAPDRSHLRVVGMIEAPEVNVTSRIAGRIEQLDVVEGDAVARGQVVCRIDATDLRNQVAQASAQLALARANLAQARLDLERTRRLFAGSVVSAEAHDEAATKVQVEEAAVQSAQAQLDLYQDQLRDTEIRSPIDGVVVNKVLQVGEWVTPGTPILTIDDLSTLWARVDVQETELAGLSVGESAEVTLPGNPPVAVPGRIMAIGQEGQFATERDVRRGRQDIRTFYVKVRLGKGAEVAKPGMTAEVSFHRQERELARDDER